MGTLWKEAGRPFLPRALVWAATLAFALGLTVPVVTFRTGLAHDTFSVLGGILDLAREGDALLAGIVLAFSVVFPVVKLALLQHALHGPLSGERRARLVHALERLGRWSMLDVFVIAILIGAMHLGILSEARAEPGIHVFALGILLAMLATRSVLALLRARTGQNRPSPARAGLFQERGDARLAASARELERGLARALEEVADGFRIRAVLQQPAGSPPPPPRITRWGFPPPPISKRRCTTTWPSCPKPKPSSGSPSRSSTCCSASGNAL